LGPGRGVSHYLEGSTGQRKFLGRGVKENSMGSSDVSWTLSYGNERKTLINPKKEWT